MPRYFMKTLAISFATGAALASCIAFAATATAETMAPEDNTHSGVHAKPSRPYYLFLPNVAIRTLKYSTERDPAWFSRNQSEQTSSFVNDKETEKNASLPVPSLFLSQETRPTASLMIGWLPAKGGANTPGPYHPDSYQYTSTGTKAGDCRAVDRTASTAVETPDSGNKGLHLPAGWLLGMCLHY